MHPIESIHWFRFLKWSWTWSLHTEIFHPTCPSCCPTTQEVWEEELWLKTGKKDWVSQPSPHPLSPVFQHYISGGYAFFDLPFLLKSGNIPIQPLSGWSTTVIYAFPHKSSSMEASTKSLGGWHGRQSAEKGRLFPTSLSPVSLNELCHVLCFYCFHGPSLGFWVLESRDKFAHWPSVSAGSVCPLTLAGKKYTQESWAKLQSWFLLRPFCFPLFCLIS